MLDNEDIRQEWHHLLELKEQTTTSPPLPITDAQRAIIFEEGVKHGIEEATRLLENTHQHVFSNMALNQGHTLVVGCSCGLYFGGLVAGLHPADLMLHRIRLEGMEEG